MISVETNLEVADNSGARRVQCIKVLGGSKRKTASVGDVIVVSDQGRDPARQGQEGRRPPGGDRPHERSPCAAPDGSAIRFDRNAAVLINKQQEPIGTRIFGPVVRELRRAKKLHEDHFVGAGGACDGRAHQEGRYRVVVISGTDQAALVARCCAMFPKAGPRGGGWASTIAKKHHQGALAWAQPGGIVREGGDHSRLQSDAGRSARVRQARPVSVSAILEDGRKVRVAKVDRRRDRGLRTMSETQQPTNVGAQPRHHAAACSAATSMTSARRWSEGVRLQEPHAGAEAREDRHQHGRRRGGGRPEEVGRGGGRTHADRRAETDQDGGEEGDRCVSRSAKACRSAAR